MRGPASPTWYAVLIAAALPLAPETAPGQEVHSLLWMRTARAEGPAVTAIAQDTAGFVWLGTRRGLLRTDGRTFEPVRFDDRPVFVAALLADRSGGIWVGTGQGLYRVDAATREVVRYRHDPADPGSISSDFVNAIFEDSRGRLWVGGLTWADPEVGGLSLFDPGTGAFRRFLHDPDDPESLSHNRVRSITETADGRIWVGTWRGLNEVDPETGRVRRWLHDPADPSSLAYDDVMALLPAPDGQLWVGTIGGGLDRFDPATGRFAHHTRSDGLRSDFVMNLLEDPGGRLWIGTLDAGVHLRSPDGSIRAVDEVETLPARGRLDRVEALFLTDDDVLWIAGASPDLHTGLLATVDTRAPDVDILEAGTAVLEAVESPEGVAWALVAGGRLLRWDRGTGDVRTFQCGRPGPDNPIIGGGGIEVGRDGSVWVGTWGGGLCRVPPDHGSIQPVPARDGEPLPRIIAGLSVGPGGDVWLSDELGRIYRISPGTGTAESVGAPGRAPAQVVPLRGVGLIDPADRALWLRTAGGLERWTVGDDGASRTGAWPGLTSVVRLGRDRDGTVWAVDGWDVCRLDPDGGRECLERRAVAESGAPVGVFGDRSGRLWIVTNHEVLTYDPGTDQARPVGLPVSADRRFFQGSGHMSTSGLLYLGGGGGLLALDTDRMDGNVHPPRIHITAFEAGGRSRDPGGGLRLRHAENDVVLRYTGLNYARPEGVRYRHRLIGHADDFVEVGGSEEVRFANLPAGRYEFRVQAISAAGVPSREAALAFRVAAPWWNNPVAWAAYGLVLAGLVLWYVVTATNRARLAARLQYERAEAERLRELDNAKSRFFANISHEFRTPLTLILGQIRAVLERPEREGNEDRLRVARNSAEQVGRMVDQILDLSRLESGGMELNAEVADIVPVVRVRVAAFQSLAESLDLTLELDAPAEPIPVRHDVDKLEMILDNLLSNALKFTPAGGRVRVRLGTDTAYPSDGDVDPEGPALPVWLEVADTGYGIPPGDADRIFDRFFRADHARSGTGRGTGIGLALTRELVALHGGTIEVTSEVGTGSRFVVRLPAAEPDPTAPGAARTAEDVDARDVDEYGAPGARPRASAADGAGTGFDSGTDDRPLILVIEDNADLRGFLRDQLAEDYHLLEAEDGEAGVTLAAESIPDLVVTDVMMPRLDGLEVARRLRGDPRTSHVPIIMLTARASEASRLEGLDTGVDDYLLKPFSRRVLLTRIRKLIELRRALREKYAGETWLRPEEVDVTPVDRTFLEQVTSTIEEHLADPAFGVDDLADAVFMSSSQLTRKLRALIDQTPGRLIRAMRLHRAAELIRKDAGNLGRIAVETGFSDQAHFSRSFKAHFGVTPSQYRARPEAIDSPPGGLTDTEM